MSIFAINVSYVRMMKLIFFLLPVYLFAYFFAKRCDCSFDDGNEEIVPNESQICFSSSFFFVVAAVVVVTFVSSVIFTLASSYA